MKALNVSLNNRTPSLLRDFDWFTLLLYILMVTAGVISIYAASYDFDQASLLNADEFSGKQIRWIGLAGILAFFIMLIDPRMFETYASPIYVVTLILLLITPFIAHDIKGSRSWISFGSMSLQPAEFAKCATALALAKLFSGYQFSLNAKLSNYVRAILIIVLPIVLILAQNETGTALTFMALFFVLYREGMSGLILFAALMAVTIFVCAVKFTDSTVLGMPSGEFWIMVAVAVIITSMTLIYERTLRVVRNVFCGIAAVCLACWALSAWFGTELRALPIGLGTIGVTAAYLIFEALRTGKRALLIPAATAVLSIGFMFSVGAAFNHLQPHQQQRIKVVLGIEDDPRGAGYNVNQSKIAIGSGGFTGKGFLNGTQTKLKYVPEQHTDFIFCTIGEEEGFVGALTVTFLFLAMILRIIHLAERQPTTFGRVYAYCVASYLIFHFCINIGMVIGLCPVIGIPLPFFSYGGSSLWGFTILLFILLKIDAARKRKRV
ncbi:MAG: rod shape-determining protein RodA [Muribaculaceae bacterium]|nr:rod shape-determining protein RodA [Muribaculaceae bacterium]